MSRCQRLLHSIKHFHNKQKIFPQKLELDGGGGGPLSESKSQLPHASVYIGFCSYLHRIFSFQLLVIASTP